MDPASQPAKDGRSRLGDVMAFAPTHKPNWTARQAVSYVRTLAAERSRDWHRACLSLCAHAYGFAASGAPNLDRDEFVEAHEYWDSSRHRHPDDAHPPVGALACWTKEGRAGHIAVVVHSDSQEVNIASNDIDDVVGIVPLEYIETHWGLSYRGWAEPDFPHGVGVNPEPPPRVGKLTDVWWQRLIVGMTGSDSVRALQRRLNVITHAGLQVTGTYDEPTRAAVAAFQRKQGWTGANADGQIYDPARGDGGRLTTRLLFPESRFDIHWTNPGGSAPLPVPHPGSSHTPQRGGAGGSATARPRPSKRPRTLSASGARMIGQFEGFRAKLYNDPAGHATIGYGHLVHRGPIDGTEPAEFRRGITQATGRRLLREDARPAGNAVNLLVSVPLSQQQFDALTSFVFNLGSASLASSHLLARLNAGDYAAVPDELAKWVHAGGQVLPGLVSRRHAEGVLFATGVYPWQSQPVSA
jgi:GH24 family phage-related lysozyme (muramidase)